MPVCCRCNASRRCINYFCKSNSPCGEETACHHVMIGAKTTPSARRTQQEETCLGHPDSQIPTVQRQLHPAQVRIPLAMRHQTQTHSQGQLHSLWWRTGQRETHSRSTQVASTSACIRHDPRQFKPGRVQYNVHDPASSLKTYM